MLIKSLPSLVKSKAQAIESLKIRVKKSKEISDLYILNENDLYSAKDRLENWRALNYDALSNIFENSSVADDYVNELGGIVNGSVPLNTRILRFETRVKNDIDKLNLIMNRITFMSESNKSKKDQPSSNIVSRDQIVQHGANSTVHISNREGNHKSWYEKWWGMVIIGVIIIILGVLVTNYVGLTTPNHTN